MTTQLKTKGTSLDTRLQHSLLLDPKLQRRLTAEEFRAFINLQVWVVSLISDGVFDTDDAEMIANLGTEHIERFHELGLLEWDDNASAHRIHPDYWKWQTSKSELRRIEEQREAARLRQERHRKGDAA